MGDRQTQSLRGLEARRELTPGKTRAHHGGSVLEAQDAITHSLELTFMQWGVSHEASGESHRSWDPEYSPPKPPMVRGWAFRRCWVTSMLCLWVD